MSQVDNFYCREAASLYSHDGDMADYIRLAFQSRYGQTWHAIVGPQFGASVTPFPNDYIDFNLGPSKIILFRT